MKDGETRSSTFMEELGIEMVSMNEGRAHFRLAVSERHFNTGKTVHGGVLMTLADTVAGAAAFSLLERGQRAVTTDAHVTCVRPVTGGVLDAEAEVLHISRRFIHVRLSIFCHDKLVTSGVISFMRVEQRN